MSLHHILITIKILITRISIDRIFFSNRCQIILFWQSKDPLDHADTPIPTANTPTPTPLSWNSQRAIQMTSRAALKANICFSWWVIRWMHFLRYWQNHRSPLNSPQKVQWRGALMFSLICVWINGWKNIREAGDLIIYRAQYDVTVLWKQKLSKRSTWFFKIPLTQIR